MFAVNDKGKDFECTMPRNSGEGFYGLCRSKKYNMSICNLRWVCVFVVKWLICICVLTDFDMLSTLLNFTSLKLCLWHVLVTDYISVNLWYIHILAGKLYVYTYLSSCHESVIVGLNKINCSKSCHMDMYVCSLKNSCFKLW